MITIAGREQADKLLKKSPDRFKSVISINSVEYDSWSTRPPFNVRNWKGPTLFLYFDDTDEGPQRDDINRIIRFSFGDKFPMLIHCTAGISRSSAAALIVMAARTGATDLSPLDIDIHWPNDTMLKLADEQLGTTLAEDIVPWRRRVVL